MNLLINPTLLLQCCRRPKGSYYNQVDQLMQKFGQNFLGDWNLEWSNQSQGQDETLPLIFKLTKNKIQVPISLLKYSHQPTIILRSDFHLSFFFRLIFTCVVDYSYSLLIIISFQLLPTYIIFIQTRITSLKLINVYMYFTFSTDPKLRKTWIQIIR